MFRPRHLISIVTFFICGFTAFGQTFPCDGNLLLFAKTSNTTAYRIDFGPFGAVYYNPRAVYLDEGFDAVGFNPKDNYIYGVKENTNSIARLRADGSHEIIGTVAQVNSLNSYAGDCSPEGLYLCHDNELDQILVFSVLNNFDLVNQIDLFWDPGSINNGTTFNTRINDFAINPNNPKEAFSFQANYNEADYEPSATRGYLLKINIDLSDPNVGMVTPVGPISSNTILQLGSLFFLEQGQLYGLGPYTNGQFVQNRLLSINSFTADANILGITTPQATMSDGCSCPYSLSFTNNIVPRDITCSNTELEFVLTINNRSNEDLQNLTISDTIPEGMLIQSITGDYDGEVAAGAGIGTRILTINNLNIPSKEIVEIRMLATVIDIPLGLIENQAYLTNLPLLFEETKASDDPTTVGFVGDVSKFLSAPIPIDEVVVEVTPPSNCLDPNDAQIIVTSPILLAGENYDIKLINQENWDELYFDVLISNEKTFLLDSLGPGDYKIVEVTPENSECSFAWKDTTILIEPPHELLQASVESNSPICEGSSLELNGTISPEGSVTWSGPESFFSTILNPQIDTAISEQSGTFEMIATYGVCEQIRTVEVFVAEDIDASIDGKLEYCKRESVQLEAKGQGSLSAFNWSGPDNLNRDSQVLVLPSMSSVKEGLYQVIIDNGVCLDTAAATISMLPSPTIVLPDIIETDFCEPVSLEPEIRGDNSVVYSWEPSGGLSCSDCFEPELQIPFLPVYRLSVINDFLCTDTAEVKVKLLKDKIVYVPNAFSPNFDGFNDNFQMFPACGVSTIKSLQIVNRWGAVVYSKNNINYNDSQEFWNGLIRGKMADTGVYVWYAEVELVDGTSLRLVGDISLLR